MFALCAVLISCTGKKAETGALKPRIVVMTDIGPSEVEPDDNESAVRLLAYADRFEIEGIITTIGWNCDPYPKEWAVYLTRVIDAYKTDVQNLMSRGVPVADICASVFHSIAVQTITTLAHGQTIEHRFLAYGIYVAAGTGKGYKRGNPGDLPFLKDWKHTQHRHRQKRDWYNAKLNSSVRRLGEFEASFYGELYKGLTVEHFTALFSS